MSLTPSRAISPVDGRYAARCAELRALFSEAGLIRARVRVEVAVAAGAGRPGRASPNCADSRRPTSRAARRPSPRSSRMTDAAAVKAIERETNHDVKAVEYFVKQQLAAHPALAGALEFVHFACTSEDINNLSYALMLPRGARAACCCRGSTR